MAIPVPESGGDFQRHLPPEGRLNSVCVDVHYLGMVQQKKFQSQEMEEVPMVVLAWAVGDAQGNVYYNPEMGWPLTVQQRYRLSLAPQAKLRKTIERWRNKGKQLTDEQVKKLQADIERPLLGQTAELSVHHSEDGKYANIDNKGEWVEPLPQGYAPMPIPANYVRIKDRPPRDAQGGQQQRQGSAPPPHAPQHADANAFAQSYVDDTFGAPPPAQRQAPRVNRYDDYQAPPLADDDEMPF